MKMEITQKITSMLNVMVEQDRIAIESIIEQRVPCNEAITNDPYIVVGGNGEGDGDIVGLVGIMNGIVGHLEGGKIFAQLSDEDGHLLGFGCCKIEDYGGEGTMMSGPINTDDES